MKNKLACWFLVFLAVIKVVADLSGWQSVSALAAVTQAAPAMKVFTAHQGYETFSSQYHLTLVKVDGAKERLTLTPKVYQGLQGPYNRRNVYGATIAYGPILSQSSHTFEMWRSVAHYAFCEHQSLVNELGFTHQGGINQVVLSYEPSVSVQSEQHQFPNQLEVSCHAE